MQGLLLFVLIRFHFGLVLFALFIYLFNGNDVKIWEKLGREREGFIFIYHRPVKILRLH